MKKEGNDTVLRYIKRNRTDSGVNVNAGDQSTALNETELVLKIKKEELFDPHVLLPHAELNAVVYNSVNIFVEKYKGDTMTLTIFSDPVNPLIQNTFREVYRAHYEDDKRKLERYLRRRVLRFVILFILSLSAYFLADHLGQMIPGYNVLLNVLVNAGSFCLWEVGYSQFATRDALDERRRVLRAMNAVIEFH